MDQNGSQNGKRTENPHPLGWIKTEIKLKIENKSENLYHPVWIKTEIKLNIEIRSENPHHPGWTKVEIEIENLKSKNLHQPGWTKIEIKMKIENLKILTTQDGEPAVCEHPPAQTRPAAEVD